MYWTKTTNAAQYDMVTFTAEVTGNTDANSYDVTVTTSEGSFTMKGVTDSVDRTYGFTMPADDVVVESVSVKVADSKLAVESAKVVGNVLTLTFNADLTTTSTVTGNTVYHADAPVGDTLKVTLKGAPQDGDQITLSVTHDAYPSDTLSNVLTYDADKGLFA